MAFDWYTPAWRTRTQAAFDTRIKRHVPSHEMIAEADALGLGLANDMRGNALERSFGMSDRIKDSIRNGKGNFIAMLGELGFLALFPNARAANRDSPNYTHDVILALPELPNRDLRIEIKTKDRGVPASLEHDASIADTNKTQNPDFYAFMSVFYDKVTYKIHSIEFMGFITPERWRTESRACKLNQRDVKDLTFEFTTDCRNLDYFRLNGPGFEPPLPVEDYPHAYHWRVNPLPDGA